MKVVLDAFGGDHAPLAAIEGAVLAAKEFGVEMILTGQADAIRKTAAEKGLSLEGIEILDAPDVIPMEADPAKIRTEYKNCSMAVGLRYVAEGNADAFVSAGSTGALIMGATLIVKRIKGIKRPALGATVPLGNNKFYLLMDCGANSECRPDMLLQFGIMGSVYYENIFGVKAPRVGLVNIGTEETKGTPLQVESHELLKNAPIHFIGNVEAREIPLGGCDVAVTDGFTGNIVLKLSEGFASFFNKTLKGMLMTNGLTKLSAITLKKPLTELKKSMDYKERGGAPILGVAAPVIKAHGSSNAYAIKNAIRQAMFCVEKDVCGQVEAGIAKVKASEEE